MVELIEFLVLKKPHYVWADKSHSLSLIDIYSLKKQVFQGDIPDLSSYFKEKSSERRDIFVVPHDAGYWDNEYIVYINELARFHRIVYFDRGDVPSKRIIHNSFKLQNARPPKHKTKSVIIPYNITDLSHIPFRTLRKIPSVSFAGFVPKLTVSRLMPRTFRSLIHPFQSNGMLIRKFGLRALAKMSDGNFSQVNTLVRSHYGGAQSLISNLELFREEYINSIAVSDLIFSPRGDANASQRFYEALSCGRIPIVPNSSMVFPKLASDSWDSLHLSVNTFSTNISSTLHTYWSDLSTRKYVEIQQRIRSIYRAELDYRKFIHNLFSHSNFDFHLQ